MFMLLNTYPKNYNSKKINCCMNTNKLKLKEKNVNGKLSAVNTVCLSKVKIMNYECTNCLLFLIFLIFIIFVLNCLIKFENEK